MKPLIHTWIALLTLSSASAAQVLYGSDVDKDETWIIDPGTAAVTVVGSQGIDHGAIAGLAYDSSHGCLYGVNSSTNRLTRISESTGLATGIGVLGGGELKSLAYDPFRHLLYTVSINGRLRGVNPDVAAGTFIGDTGLGDQVEGLAFDESEKRLYGLTRAGQVYVIDRFSGATTPLPNPIGPSGNWSGLAWDSRAGNLLASIAGGGTLWRVDPIGGTGVLVGPLRNAVQGLAMTEEAAPAGDPLCWGDGSGGACPCFNYGGSGLGCANSATVGASLQGNGYPVISEDSFFVAVYGLPPGKPGILIQGENLLGSGAGNPVGDGLLCFSPYSRWSVQWADAAGVVHFGQGSLAQHPRVTAGETLYYQWWYRDPMGPCGSGFNFTNAWGVTWQP